VLRVIVLVALATPAFAEPTEEADRLFEEGRALAKDQHWPEACDRFERSFQIDPSIGTTLNLADCHEHLGHLRKAWELFEAAAAKAAQAGDKREGFAHERSGTVGKSLATVVVRLPRPMPANVVVMIGGRGVVAAAEIHERVDPGDVEVIASIPEKPRFAKTVAANKGAVVEVDVPPTFGAPVVVPEVGTRRARSRVRLAFGLTIGGAGSAVAATLLTLKAKSDYNTAADGPNCMHVTGGIRCNDTGDKAITSAQRLADIGTGFAIGAAALVGAAAIVYFTAPREPLVVAPVASEHSLGLAVRRSF
jgi:hypothetical protein